MVYRMSSPDVFSKEGVLLQICCIFTEEHPYRSVISVELNSHFFMDVLLQTGYMLKTFLEKHLWVTASVYVEVNTTYASRHSLVQS